MLDMVQNISNRKNYEVIINYYYYFNDINKLELMLVSYLQEAVSIANRYALSSLSI